MIKHIVEVIKDGILITDQQGKIRFYNKKALQLLKQDSSELLGKNVKDLFTTSRSQKLFRSLKKEQIPRFFTKYPDQNGTSHLYLEFSISALPVALRKLTYVYTIRDVTQQKLTEKRLRKSEKKYRKLFEDSRDAIFITNTKGQFLDFNQAMLDLIGYSKEEVGQLNAKYLYFNPGDRNKFIADIKRRGSLRNYEVVLKSKNGEKLICLETTTVRKSKNSDNLIYQGILRDITEQKRVEKALRESEARFRSVTQSALDAIVVTDNNLKVNFWSNGARHTFGYSAKSIIGKKISCLFEKKEYHRLIQAHKNYSHRTTNQKYVLELTGRRRNNKTFPAELSISTWETHKQQYFTFVIRDITFRKQTEDFKRAKEVAEKAARLKADLLANMSHEIRTPMNVILGLLEMLFDTKLQKEQKELLEHIHLSSKNLMVIINDILDLSKIEAGKITFHDQPFSVKSFIDNLEKTCLPKTKKQGLELQIQLDPNIPDLLMGDMVRLNQIMLNLLTNAIKFTEKGYIKIDVRHVSEEKRSHTLEFSITDSGIGIPKSLQDKIFDSFIQSNSKRTKKLEGTGLGLAIVKKLVQLQGGKINLKSRLHHGTTFTIQLPFKKCSKKPSATPSKSTDEFHIPDLNGLKVLLVEDNDLNQVYIKKLFKDKNCQLSIANHGQEAIDLLTKQSFDLILMDVLMPVMNGYETTEHIRKKMPNQIKNIPILAMTAYVTNKEKKRCLEYGMNDYIPKPINKKLLFKKIAMLTGHKKFTNIKRENGNGRKKERKKKKLKYLDLSYLYAMSDGDQVLMQKIIHKMLANTQDDLKSLQKHIREKNWDRTRAVAHKLNNTAQFIGFKPLQENIHTIEKNALHKKQLKKMSKLIAKAQQNYDYSVLELKQVAKTPKDFL